MNRLGRERALYWHGLDGVSATMLETLPLGSIKDLPAFRPLRCEAKGPFTGTLAR
jgi:hypothetical protein